jgi:hypothetical protein
MRCCSPASIVFVLRVWYVPTEVPGDVMNEDSRRAAGFALGGFAPDMPQWGIEFKKNLRDFPRMMYTLSHHMALAVESNSITLDPVAKDVWACQRSA